MHRRQQLHRLNDFLRPLLQPIGDALAQQLFDRRKNLLLALSRDEIEIAPLAGVGEFERLALEDAMGIDYDETLAVLAKYPPQHRNRHGVGVDQILEHAA